MNADFDANHTRCIRGDYGSGSEGDYSVVCTWRIPMVNMFLESTFFAEMRAAVSNKSLTNRPSAVSDDITAIFDAPIAHLHGSACPIGPGAFGDAFLIGTNVTCKCILYRTVVPTAFVRWFTQDGRIVGVEDKGSSIVTMSYNYSDPDQSYECRPVTPLRVNISSRIFHPKFINYPVLAEEGQPAALECSFPNNVTSATWQIVDDDVQVNLSTCSFVDNNCTQQSPLLYKGFISSSGSDRVMGLNIHSVRRNETEFVCLANNGLKSNISALDVYAWPIKPQCEVYDVSNEVLSYYCRTDNVYPGVDAVTHRRERDFSELGINVTNHQCFNDPYTAPNGEAGDYNIICEFTVPIKNLPFENHMYVEMTARVSNKSAISRKPAVSDDFIGSLSVPVARLEKFGCPVGPGVRGDSIIIGTEATCKCDLKPIGSPMGFARWFTTDHVYVGSGSLLDIYRFSYLNLVYNSSDPNRSYECWPITVLNATVTPVIYTPKFIPSQCVITRLHPLVIILGVVCSGIISRLALT